MRTTTLEHAQVLHVKAGDVQPGDEVVYLIDSVGGARDHVTARIESVSFNEHHTWITMIGPELPRQLPVTHPVVVVRGLALAA